MVDTVWVVLLVILRTWKLQDIFQCGAWVNELATKFPVEELPKEYRIEVCTYREACERALKLYGDTMDIGTIGGPTLKFDLTLTKNKLRNILGFQ